MHAYDIAPMTALDWEAVRNIYRQGISSGNATFEQSVPGWDEWDKRHLPTCRLVVRTADQILGWAALSAVSTRRVYAGVAEVSIYIADRERGRGIGASLLQALVEASEQNGIWTLQAGIFPENTASIKLHERAGFGVVGIRERLGCMNGRWRNIVLMERRSEVTGV